MVTVVNNPKPESDSGSNGMWGFLGIALVILFIAVLIFYGLPLLRSSIRSTQAPSINVPDKIEVDINRPE